MNGASDAAGLRLSGTELLDRWTAMWNGDVAIADQIMAPEFTLRYAQANTERIDEVRTPRALAELVRFWHSFRPGIRFSTEAEAAIDLASVDEFTSRTCGSVTVASLIVSSASPDR